MSGSVVLERDGGMAWATLSHACKIIAMSRAMWHELRKLFEAVQLDQKIRCVVVRGTGGHSCAGGAISEYADFRFEEASLRDLHEGYVWGGLHAMLDCDVPIVAQIEGNCMGAGLELASCCDLRLASTSARFGAPIAKLGFPIAPREAALVFGAVGELTVREMLLAASVLDAHEMKQRGFLNSVVADVDISQAAQGSVERICGLAPGAARRNKQSFRARRQQIRALTAMDLIANAYRYADTAEHREGVTAFVEKRPPQFL